MTQAAEETRKMGKYLIYGDTWGFVTDCPAVWGHTSSSHGHVFTSVS